MNPNDQPPHLAAGNFVSLPPVVGCRSCATLWEELMELRASIAWRCRDCGCAFPDFPEHMRRMAEGVTRCSTCVTLEVVVAQRDSLQARLEALQGAVQPCPQCGGTGLVDAPSGYTVTTQGDCPACGGKGVVGD